MSRKLCTWCLMTVSSFQLLGARGRLGGSRTFPRMLHKLKDRDALENVPEVDTGSRMNVSWCR